MARRTGSTQVVRGLRELQKASTQLPNNLRKRQRAALRPVGEAVRLEQVRQMTPVSRKSAAGYRTSVRQTGVVVRQSLRKTTGKRPDYGAFQMRRLIRATAANEDKTVRALEQAMDDVGRIWERVPGGP